MESNYIIAHIDLGDTPNTSHHPTVASHKYNTYINSSVISRRASAAFSDMQGSDLGPGRAYLFPVGGGAGSLIPVSPRATFVENAP